MIFWKRGGGGCRGKWNGACRPPKHKNLCGWACILLGVIVLICFLPEWLLALICAGICFAVGACLLGPRR